ALWYRSVEPGLKVTSDVGRGILVEGQRRRSVLDQQVQDSDQDPLDARHAGQHFAGHQMKATRPCLQGDLLLEPDHRVRRIRTRRSRLTVPTRCPARVDWSLAIVAR